MNNLLIEKFALKATNVQTGTSFKHNVVLYELLDDYLIGECNSVGEPTPGILIVFPKQKGKYVKFTEAFLLNVPQQELKAILGKQESVWPEVN